MPFDSFLGNTHCVQILRAALRRARLPHALLFAGPDAVGKRFLAQQLAMTLNCQGSIADDWCGICRSCRLIQLGNHPDVSILEPEGDGQVIKIERVRQLIREAVRNPFQGKNKVFILDEAHRLNPASGNALLKILEEPPLSSKLVLVTSQPHALLTTIRSRCQLVQFAGLTESEIAAILESRFTMNKEEASQRAGMAGGSLGKAVSLDLKRCALLAEAARSFLLMSISEAGLREIADTLARIGKERQDTEEWIGMLLQELRGLAHAGAAQTRQDSTPLSFAQIERMARASEQLRRNLDHNISRPLALENLYLLFVRIAERGPTLSS
jgi:DNA polymerase-3 subunit delta'